MIFTHTLSPFDKVENSLTFFASHQGSSCPRRKINQPELERSSFYYHQDSHKQRECYRHHCDAYYLKAKYHLLFSDGS